VGSYCKNKILNTFFLIFRFCLTSFVFLCQKCTKSLYQERHFFSKEFNIGVKKSGILCYFQISKILVKKCIVKNVGQKIVVFLGGAGGVYLEFSFSRCFHKGKISLFKGTIKQNLPEVTAYINSVLFYSCYNQAVEHAGHGCAQTLGM
jgi:hypothetical protein